MTIYNNIDQNKRDTVLVVAVFVAMVVFLGWFVSQVYYEADALMFTSLAFIVSGVSGLVSYYNSDKLVLAISGALEADKIVYHDLYNLVENMSIASGIPVPKVYLIDDTALNAFATGRDPQHGVIVFTTGIVNSLEKRELEGVVAHEMSHIGNYDIRLMSIVSILFGMVTLLSDWFTRGIFYGSGRKRSGNVGGSVGIALFVIGLVLVILSPIIATVIKLAISRNREYLADSTAALITRYPKGLADALKKLATDGEILEAANGATAHLYIANPIKHHFSSLFNTHPPIEERIRRLESM